VNHDCAFSRNAPLTFLATLRHSFNLLLLILFIFNTYIIINQSIVVVIVIIHHTSCRVQERHKATVQKGLQMPRNSSIAPTARTTTATTPTATCIISVLMVAS
jgi:hypothetical protein